MTAYYVVVIICYNWGVPNLDKPGLPVLLTHNGSLSIPALANPSRHEGELRRGRQRRRRTLGLLVIKSLGESRIHYIDEKWVVISHNSSSGIVGWPECVQ